MLRQLLDPAKWVVEIAAVETLTADLVAQVAEQAPALVCIGALPPGGLAHTRYLCKKLRARFPEVKIVVGRWGLTGGVEANREQLQDAGADLTATTMLETRSQLNSLLPILTQRTGKAHGGLTGGTASGIEGGWQKATQGWRKALSMGRLGGGRVCRSCDC